MLNTLVTSLKNFGSLAFVGAGYGAGAMIGIHIVAFFLGSLSKVL